MGDDGPDVTMGAICWMFEISAGTMQEGEIRGMRRINPCENRSLLLKSFAQ